MGAPLKNHPFAMAHPLPLCRLCERSFDGVFCLLAHLQHQSITLGIGDKVNQGELLGCIGHNGSSHGPHLHL